MGAVGDGIGLAVLVRAQRPVSELLAGLCEATLCGVDERTGWLAACPTSAVDLLAGDAVTGRDCLSGFVGPDCALQ